MQAAPYTPSPQADAADGQPQGGQPQGLPLHRVALIIEDDPQFSRMLAYHLLQAGYDPVQCERGQDAIAASLRLRSGQGPPRPALITLDILLPDVDGWSVLREIRRAPLMQRVPVLVISVLSEAELGVGCGPTAFLYKPTSRLELIEAIARLAPRAPTPTRVLLVDDDPLMSELLHFMLRPPQFEIRTAAGARQAAEMLASEKPDVILLDLVLPEVNGFELLQALRADAATRALPVLVLTAKHLSPQEQIDLSQAAQLVMTKERFTLPRMLEKLHLLERAMPLLHASPPVGRDGAPPTLDVDLSLFREDFRDEARAHLSVIRAFAETGDVAVVEDAARAAHTLKGSAAMMGYSEIGELAAHAERLLLDVRDGTTPLYPLPQSTLRDIYQRIEQIVEDLMVV